MALPNRSDEMNILLVNPYDYKTVQSNPGLLSLLQVLEKERISYVMTVAGSFPDDGFKYTEIPEKLMSLDANSLERIKSHLNIIELTHIIAIDPEGAMVAMRLREVIHRKDIHYSYISYEILYSDEIIFPHEQKLKEYDLAYLRLCKEVLVQDEVRGKMFCKEVGIDFTLFYAPVSPHQYLGRGRNRNAIKRELGLPLDKNILIYSGSLAPYAKPDWWIKIAEILPNNFIFLFTCFDGRQFLDPNLARIGRILSGKGNAFFIKNELPTSYYMQVLQACDVGIALFRPVYTHWMNGRNIREMGLSSGKFCNYVSCGLPVICDSDQEEFRKLAAHYPIVQTISTPEEVASKLETLSQIGDESEMWCKKLFHEVLNPYNGIRRYLDALR